MKQWLIFFLILPMGLANAQLFSKKEKLYDAVLLKDSTKIMGEITYLSDFILHLEPSHSKEDLTFFSDDVSYVMVSPQSKPILRTIRGEITNNKSVFKKLMEKGEIFGFTFLLGNDTILDHYSMAISAQKGHFDRHKYDYKVEGKTMEERFKSLGKGGGFAGAAILLLILL